MLRSWGHVVAEQPLDGYRADLLVDGVYQADIKVPMPGSANLAIAADAFDNQAQTARHWYFWRHPDGDWRWDTTDSLLPRMIGGRRAATERGSNTDWYLFSGAGARVFRAHETPVCFDAKGQGSLQFG